MVKINRIYTRTGDDGTTGLVGGERCPKDSSRVEAYGAVDELNSLLGMVRCECERSGSTRLHEMIALIQNELFDIGAELATPAGKEWPSMARANASQITRLEKWIDELTEGLPELRSFVLPGGSALNSVLHLARAVCRRAERRTITFGRTLGDKAQEFGEAIRYLNRLSDLLFAMARAESARAGTPEILWEPGKTTN